MSPLNLGSSLGTSEVVSFGIGVGFGMVLEMAGFGDSRRLAAQFFFREMRVLKTMFSAIITAMLLIFLASSVGLVDFAKLFVNPTFLWPGIIGGFVMGLGFIIGGFCPGTSVVGVATLKVDAMVFLGGVFLGAFFFGEAVPSFHDAWNASSYGRLTLDALLDVDAGWVVLGVLLMALGAFAAAGWAERRFGTPAAVTVGMRRGLQVLTGLGLLVAVVTVALGQPDATARWGWIAASEQPKLDRRELHVHPGELRELMLNNDLQVELLDLRSESDFNLFHLEGARRTSVMEASSPTFAKRLSNAPSNLVTVLISTSEQEAVKVWRTLRAFGVLNLYVLDGGINRWLDVFPLGLRYARPKQVAVAPEQSAFEFTQAVGSSQFASFPYDPVHAEKNPKIDCEKKVKLQAKSFVKGGCG